MFSCLGLLNQCVVSKLYVCNVEADAAVKWLAWITTYRKTNANRKSSKTSNLPVLDMRWQPLSTGSRCGHSRNVSDWGFSSKVSVQSRTSVTGKKPCDSMLSHNRFSGNIIRQDIVHLPIVFCRLIFCYPVID